MRKSDIKLLEELEVANGFSNSFIESLHDGFFITNSKGKVIVVNSSLTKITGFDKEELIGAEFPFPFWPPELHDEFTKGFKKMMKENLSRENETMYMRKNGACFPVLVFMASIKNNEDQVIAHIGLIQYVAKNKKNKNQDIFSILNYRNKYLDLIVEKNLISQLDYVLDGISDGLISLDSNLCYTYVNNRAGEILNRKPSDLVGKHIWTEFPDIVDYSFYSLIYKALETQEKQYLQEYYEPYGVWFDSRIYPSGKRVTVYFTDVTEAKLVEKKIIRNEKYFENIINNIGDPIFVKDDKSQFVLVNDAFCNLLNISRIELIGKTLSEKVSKGEDRTFLSIDQQILSKGIVNEYEDSLVVKGKESKLILIKKTRYIDDNKNKFIIGVIRDITERKKAELAIKLEKDFTDKLVMSLQEGLIVTEVSGKILSVNDALCEMTGYAREELVGQNPPYPFWVKDEYENIIPNYEKVAAGESVELKFKLKRKNGEVFIGFSLAGNIIDDKGSVIALFGTMKDISDEEKSKKILEENARKSKEKKNVILELANLVGEDFIDSLKKITSLAARTLNIGRVSIWSFGVNNDNLTCEKLFDLKSESYTIGTVLNKLDNPKYFKALEERETILVMDAQKNSLTKSFAQKYFIPNNIKSRMDVFINSTSGYYGIICFEHVGEYLKDWTADDQEFATSIANIVSLMVESTERKKAELELKSAKEYSENLIKFMHEGLVIINLNADIISVNPAFCEMTGFDESELLGTNVPYPFSPPENLKIIKERLKKLKKGELNISFESVFLGKNGKRFPVDILVSTIYDDKGVKVGDLATVKDITERRKAEIELQSAKDFSEGLIESMSDGLIVFNKDLVVLGANAALFKMVGFAKEEIIGNKIPLPFHPSEDKDREKLFGIIKKLFNDELKGVFETEYLNKAGNRIPVLLSISKIYDDKGEIEAYFALVQDITERKKQIEEIRAAREFSEELLLTMAEGLAIVDLRGVSLNTNDALCKMTGFTKEELTGIKSPFPYWPKESYPQIDLAFKNTLKGIDSSYQFNFMRKNGDRFPVSLSAKSLKDKDGKKVAFFATIQDLTEQKKAELDLKLEKEFTDKLVMSMQEGLIIVNPLGEIIMVNSSTCKILGYKNEELVGLKLPYPFAKLEDFEEIARTNKKVAAGEAPSFQFEFIRKNGEKFLATFLTGNITNDKDEVIALFGTMKDISKEEKAKKALERRAIKSNEKKEVILELANLVGEDFKNSLKKITKLTSETLDVERVSVWSFDYNESKIICERLYSLKSKSFSNGIELNKQDNPEYFNELNKSKTIIISDAQNNNITKQFAKNYLVPNKIVSLMDVFINSTNGYYGIICFEHVGEELREWTAEDHEFATSIASIVSLMVESTERKLAESKIILANEELFKVNTELNILREKLEQENVYLRNELDLVFNYEEMVYGSIEFSNVLTELEKVAPTTATVLLLGESGTGKELIARALHNTSQRNKKPLIKINCSAIPRELIESELFGHKKGSFTGAFNDKVGKFELADGGTLFLDEIGELPLDMQPKILRFLQEGEIEVVGAAGLKKLNVRVIAATNRNLKEEIEKKQFREDLYFRLNVFPIVVPPLRERKDDIPLLVEHFVDKFNKAYDKTIKYIPDDTITQLKSYNWPGNIRELENLIERALILSNAETLVVPGFESSLQLAKQPGISKDVSLDAIQRNYILQVLQQCNWKISGPNGASYILNLKPSTLRDKMKKLGIKKPN